MKNASVINQSLFLSKVDTSPGLGPWGTCHLWTGATLASGSGAYKTGTPTRNFKAHRVAHFIEFGELSDDLFCLRACGHPLCVNPRHLYLSERKGGDFRARLCAAVDHRVGQGPRGECWEYSGPRTAFGYGEVTLPDNRRGVAHRLVHEMWHGDLPRHLMACHRCDNRLCCRPDHLFAGTHQENMHDRNAKGRTSRTRRHAKLSEAQAIEIRDDRRSLATIASEYNVSTSTVSMIRSGKRWVSLPPA